MTVEDSMADRWDFETVARAQAAVAEYKDAKRLLALARAEYESEENVRDGMLGGFAIFGGACLLWLLFGGFTASTLEGYPPAELVVFLPLTVLLSVGISAWAGCIPAGFAGMWRQARKSGAFLLGSPAAMLIVMAVLCLLPALTGPIYFARQRSLVKRLGREVAAAEARFNAAKDAIHL